MCTAVFLSTPWCIVFVHTTCVEGSIRQTEEVSEETTCNDFRKEGRIQGQRGVVEKEEEVGGAERCQDQEERMSIIAATAPQ